GRSDIERQLELCRAMSLVGQICAKLNLQPRFSFSTGQDVVSKTSSIVLKAVGASVAVTVAAYALFYGFFIAQQELGVEPSTAYRVAIAAFLISLLISWIYFRAKAMR